MAFDNLKIKDSFINFDRHEFCSISLILTVFVNNADWCVVLLFDLLFHILICNSMCKILTMSDLLYLFASWCVNHLACTLLDRTQ